MFYFLTPTQSLWASIGLLLVVIIVIVFIHELGHFLVAKKNGVRVAEFSVGFGPKLYSFYRSGTTYSFRLLPFGGYVSVLSKRAVVEIEKIKNQPLTEEQVKAIHKKLYGLGLYEDYSWQKPIDDIKWYQKLWFSLAGVTFNVISALFILTLTFFFIGQPTTTNNLVYSQAGEYWSVTGITYVDTNGVQAEATTSSDMKEVLKNPADNIQAESAELAVNVNSTPSGLDLIYETTDIYNIQMAIDILDGTDSVSITASGYFTTIETIPTYNFWSDIIDVGNDALRSVNPLMVTEDQYEFFPFTSTGYPAKYISNLWFISLDAIVFFDTGIPTIGLAYSDQVANAYTHLNLPIYQYLQPLNMLDSFAQASVESWNLFVDSWLLIGNIFSFGALNDQIAENSNAIIFDVDELWWSYTIIYMIAQYSILLMVFNILPIPPLDGWKSFEAIYEGIRKKEISPKASDIATKVGWVIIAFVFITGLIVPFV